MKQMNLREELERWHPESFGWALHLCDGNPEEAGEILQEVYLKILDGRARFGGASSFKTWLFAVIRNTTAEQVLVKALRLIETILGGKKGPEDKPK